MTTVREWCRCAQEDEQQKKCILYSNYRHTRMEKLISNDGIESFKAGLAESGGVSAIAPLHPGIEYGVAHLAIDKANLAIYRIDEASRPIDFRLAGQSFAFNDVLVNLWYRSASTVPSSSTAGGLAGGHRPVSATARANEVWSMKWLTRADVVVKKIAAAKKTLGRPLDELAFFAELVSLLGLRPQTRSPMSSCSITLYVANRDDALRRPHAITTGYPERFCGATTSHPFGSTADNRTGTSGLPEAVAFERDLLPLDHNDPRALDFRDKLAPYTNFLSVGSHGQLSGTFRDADLQGGDADRFRKTALRRLGQGSAKKSCTLKVCYCERVA